MQDDRNDTSQSERSELAPVIDENRQRDISVPPAASAPSDAWATETATTSSADAVDDESEQDATDERGEMASESDAAETPSESNGVPAQGTNSTSSIATADPDEEDRSEIAKQPYDFERCTVQIAIQLLPDDGDPNGRMVVVGTRSHLDTPILRFMRWNELGTLPPVVNALLDQLKSEFPIREQAAHAAYEKKKEEQAKRKVTVNAPKTSARGKKTKAATLATPPTSATTVTDNRPRPEVQATTAPQQQMGLF